MPIYRVTWKHYTHCTATVEANSETEAIEKAQNGEYRDDIDTEPGANIPRSFECEGLA